MTVHPLDQLSHEEINKASSVVLDYFSTNGHNAISFNTITLKEPTKQDYLAWKEKGEALPHRVAYYVAVEADIKGVHEGLVDLNIGSVYETKSLENFQPMLTVADLSDVEEFVRKDPNVIEQCKISGIPEAEMHNVYCDPWAIGYDERWGSTRRLQQALMYYRSNEDDSQYSHPLDFCPILDANTKEIIYIDIPSRRRPLSKFKHANFHTQGIKEKYGGFRDSSKTISISQPNGVSFTIDGSVLEWSNFKFHIGFNNREGIVLSDITYNDHGNVRPLFYRLSLAEMIVPYGCPDFPHQRKHALDIGEYGAGFMTNPLKLGCDCKGVIHYLDAHFADRHGKAFSVPNAVCIHEEDDGLLYKHSDFRDEFQTTIVTRATKLIVSQIFTAANYEYCLYWNFHQDGTIGLDVKLTGILNTYVLADGEDAGPWGTQVYPLVNAHNHQHLFALRVHPRIDGDGNSIGMSDGTAYEAPIGSKENFYGNGFYCKKTTFEKVKDSLTQANASTGRTWDFFNPNKKNAYSGKPPSYKLVSNMTPTALSQEGSWVCKRAPWSTRTVQVVPYKDDRFYPSGKFVTQWSGEQSDDYENIVTWIGDGEDNITNTDLVMFHTFGLTHFPAPEDFPLMPSEPISLIMRPRHFFLENPALDVKPSYVMTTSEATKQPLAEIEDKVSRLAFDSAKGECCGK
ncbi:hypothetical protein LJB42_001956 [Komagataella kurtzmanii]|nr:hypothetical protein LJB42_001956 [Komagataella kurtzmanii]